ncbi:F-box/kelch-repeat protein At3g06240-like [Mercurialis annua]|uniref:F-box/kelch-repeat protein At3g06240-like n=1 Tax=Mercurialis annua TaxID=3986 RepID=UPI00215F889E|nr:F-box/kelch-repeat protein At3g06240-like [Mercurialis annua]
MAAAAIAFSEYLPEEVVVQILIRLPVKCILKFSCVCKLWNCIIKSPNFISTFASNKHDSYIFLLHCDMNNYKYSIRIDNKDFNKYRSIRPLLSRANRNFLFPLKVVGSSNGLLCLYDYLGIVRLIKKFIIWNPSIRKSLLIPQPCSDLGAPHELIGFGFDSRTNDYKLLANGFMYSLNCNSWKEIMTAKNITNRIWLSKSVFIHGRFHWLVFGEEKNVVLMFDLRDEMFREISLPQCLENVRLGYLRIQAFGESSIAVTHVINNIRREYDIWVMEEYGTGEWTKLATVGKCWNRPVELNGGAEDLSDSNDASADASMCFYFDIYSFSWRFYLLPSLHLLCCNWKLVTKYKLAL